jgi:gliding motility-associated-like protein
MLSGNTHYMQLTAPYTAGAQYAWSTGDNSEVLQATRSGSYSVVVTSDQGCRQVFQTTVQLIDLTQIPNTFSPNHDGINDYWMVKALDAFPNATAQVFNRSGVKVWEARSPGVRWDGTSGGRELPAGVYFYVLDLKDGSTPVNGWINLLR